MPVHKRYFGTDGIRGQVGQWPITAEFMLRLGRAMGVVLRRDTDKPVVLIGKDTRVSGYMFESALEAGLLAAGAEVRLLGPMPTPGVAYLTRSMRADAGIVISASHNPHQDNGIKFFSAVGEKLDDDVELAIEAEIDAPFSTVESQAIGKAMRIEDASARYLEFCKSTVSRSFNLHGVHVVVDCAHGATYQIAPKMFSELGARVTAIGNRPDGLNINRDCGSTSPGLLSRTVVETGADLGIAFDGDGDRLQMVDAGGRVIDGDELLYVLAVDWHGQGRLRGPLVGTLMSNFGLEQAMNALGVPFLRTRVGDRFVMQALREREGVLGGETSGHILCLDRVSTGDAIVSALQVLEALARGGRSLGDSADGMRKIPQTTVNIRASGGAALVADAGVQQVLADVQAKLAGLGRVVLRPSGTEPLVRVTVEAFDADLVARLVDELANAVREAQSRVS
ncbi:MAG: phosphoglucosamine mutase [Dokdonella sp.]|uniref:phosphoglucosamine mutase n=1 Tax=Dokdonella sp. TaxID=2291710 RepID=UPI002CDE17F0|nr:phosphoglucosamine mutase [Dokdonella sp.]HPG95152.1 phosphoglucosamine mutase [Dokdonella sp.]HPN79202.1 phosphoglucosamine mutase [Dokdonella sp.]